MTEPPTDPPTAGERPLLVLLHGHGSDPTAVEPIGRIVAAHTDSVLWCPAGPCAVDGSGDLARAWWEPDADGPDPATIDELVAALVVHDGPVHLAGFSQGAATVLTVASAYSVAAPGRHLRVVVVAGFLSAGGAVPAGADVLVVHGEADESVDPFHADLIVRRCRRNGCTVTEVRHDGGHRWDDAVTDTVVAWIAPSGR